MSNFDPNDVLSNLEIVEAYNTLENNLGSLQAYQNLGISLAKQGLLSEALACYRRILAFKYQEIDNSFLANFSVLKTLSVDLKTLSIIPEQKTQITTEKILSLEGNQGFILYGPYIDIPDGLYRIKIDFEFIELEFSSSFKFDIVAPYPSVLYETEVKFPQEKLEFTLEVIEGKSFEFRFFATGSAFSIHQIELETIYQPSNDRGAAFYYFDLGSLLKVQGFENKADIAYQRVVENLALGSVLDWLKVHAQTIPYLSEWAGGYLCLKNILEQHNREDEAKACEEYYQKVIKLFPDRPTSIHEIFLLCIEKRSIEEARYFLKKGQKKLTQEEIYGKIWAGLNQLGVLSDDNLDFLKVIEYQSVYNYFKTVSNYKIINLDFLSAEDYSFLKSVQIVFDYIRLIKINSFNLEEVYLNFDNISEPIKLSKKYPKKEEFNWSVLKPKHFQQTLVETGYIYTQCPFTGKVLRSNQSFYINWRTQPIIFYYFQGSEIFYLLVGGWSGSKIGIYIPKFELIITFDQYWEEIINPRDQVVINQLKASMVTCCKQVKHYMGNQERKELAALFGFVNNLGHHYWNGITGINFLRKNEILKKIDKFLIGPFYRKLDITDIFPDLPQDKLVYCSHIDITLFQSILEGNYCAVLATDSFIEESLIAKISEAAFRKCSSDLLKQVELAKKDFPLLWINLRSHNKAWISQVEGYINIITKLAEKYPNLAIVFDGYSNQKEAMNKIVNMIPSFVKTYDTLGCAIYESFVWADAIDSYISVIGSGLTVVTWIANKPGIAHSDRGHYAQIPLFWLDARENLIEPVLVPQESIIPVNHPNESFLNYDCDWQIIYELIEQVIRQI